MNKTAAGGLLMVYPLPSGVRGESDGFADVLSSKPVGSESKLSCNGADCGRTCWCEKTNIDDSFEIVSSPKADSPTGAGQPALHARAPYAPAVGSSRGLAHAPQPFAVAEDEQSALSENLATGGAKITKNLSENDYHAENSVGQAVEDWAKVAESGDYSPSSSRGLSVPFNTGCVASPSARASSRGVREDPDNHSAPAVESESVLSGECGRSLSEPASSDKQEQDSCVSPDVNPFYSKMNDKLEGEILGSRLGGFGSSDAKMIYNIGLRGSLTAGDRERIAVYLGLKQPQHRSTEATVNGHRREQEVFNMLCYDHLVDGWWDVAGAEAETCEDRAGSRFVSNPCVKNTELSRLSGIYCFTHIDITFRQLAPDTSWKQWQVVWYEVKTSRNETAQVLSDYRLQLFWHMWALEDFVHNQGEDDYEIRDYWLDLLHYKEDNIGGVFSRGKVKEEGFYYEAGEFAHFKETILAGLKVIAGSFEAVRAGFVERGEQYLARQDFPEEVAEGLEQLAAFLLKAKKFEAQEAQLKASVRALMEEKQWRRCSTPWFSISLSSDSTRTTLDANKVKEKYPEVYKECLKSAPAKGSLRLELSKSYIVEHGDARGLEEGGVAEEVKNV